LRPQLSKNCKTKGGLDYCSQKEKGETLPFLPRAPKSWVRRIDVIRGSAKGGRKETGSCRSRGQGAIRCVEEMSPTALLTASYGER